MYTRRLLLAQLGVLILLHISQSIGAFYFDVSPNNGFFAITHLLGGAWAAFLILWIGAMLERKVHLWLCVVAALSAGLAWEFFEVAAALTGPESPRYIPDTVSDIMMDALGGLVGGLLARKSSLFDTEDVILSER